MGESPDLYPSATVNWSSKNKNKLKLECNNNITDISITPVTTISYNSVVKFLEDFSSSGQLTRFNVDVGNPSTIGVEGVTEYGIRLKITLKTLF